MAIQNLFPQKHSSYLDGLVQNKLQKMQQRDLLKNLLSNQQQGQQGNALEYVQPQSFSLSDLLQGGQQNAIERSVGKTPLRLPSYGQTSNGSTVKSGLQPQLPISPAQQQSILSAEKKTAGERKAEIEGKNAQAARIDKETLPYYKKIKDQYASTAEVDARLDEMEDLLSTGNVQSGVFLRGLDALSQIPYVGKLAGAVEQALLTDESQVFKKLSTDFIRDAKPYFGSNLSTREVELFLERVPSLMLSNEGNRAVIRNFRAINEYIKSTDKIMEGIIAENGGERPRHLESKVQARMKPAAENLRKAFKDSAKLIPGKGTIRKAAEIAFPSLK